jgi:hypothetical protein
VEVHRPLRERLIDLEDAGESTARGRAHRKVAPRRSLAELVGSSRSATEILVGQSGDRLADLVPLRFARMLTDPFSFYRGSAAVMAADLAVSPSSGVEVMCCGDAHLSNFGIYASPQRSLVFDINDFDEQPWQQGRRRAGREGGGGRVWSSSALTASRTGWAGGCRVPT